MARRRSSAGGGTDIFLIIAFTIVAFFSVVAFSPGITLAAIINRTITTVELNSMVLWIINLVFTFMLCLALFFKSGWHFYKLYFKINVIVFVLVVIYSFIFKDMFFYNTLKKMYSIYF